MRRKPRIPRGLGDLETAIMQVAWARGAVTVQDVVAALRPRRDLAYTTVMTVLTRLAGKRLLTRRKVGRAFVYEPAFSRDATARTMMGTLVRRVYAGATADAIAHLIEDDPDIDEDELDRLEELIRRRRGGA